MKLIKILNQIDKFNKHLFDVPVAEQKSFLNSLKEPQNDVDRSYNQFLCQMYFYPLWVRIFWTIVSVLAYPLVSFVLFIKCSKVKYEYKVEAIAADHKMEEVIPLDLRNSYDIHHKEWNAGCALSKEDFKYIFKNIVGFRHPFFILKTTIQIASYSARITRYTPDVIITHGEYSFCSSALTDYCHSKGVKHINVMHGEKLFYIRDSFFHFDECFVWDQHYIDLFVAIKAESSQFKIAIPPSMIIDMGSNINQKAYSDYKYYLASDNEEQIKSIVESMQFAKRENKKVKYRIHPRYTDIDVLLKYVSDTDIEYPSEISILESIANSNYVIGSYTTVLLQACMAGKQIVLDDVTYHKRYYQLENYGYILAEKQHIKLSDLQKTI